MFVKSTRFKQVCQLLLSLIVAIHDANSEIVYPFKTQHAEHHTLFREVQIKVCSPGAAIYQEGDTPLYDLYRDVPLF